jgi:hypothetical protein
MSKVVYGYDTMWIQFRRRLDKLEPFCRIAGHTSEEVREILAALETMYRRTPSSKRKTCTPVTSQRWAMEQTIWEVVGGERT